MEEPMTDAQMPLEEIEQEIARLTSLIAECERRMAVHPTQLDDRKKGEHCPNRRARMQHQRRRDELVRQVEALHLKNGVCAAPVKNPVEEAPAEIRSVQMG
jgi:predicted  nucleic acid-binding Zn-ribbon protein